MFLQELEINKAEPNLLNYGNFLALFAHNLYLVYFSSYLEAILTIRGIIIIAGIVTAIMAVIILPNNPIAVRPGIEDSPQMLTNASLGVSPSRADDPMLTENAAIISSIQDDAQIFANTSLGVSPDSIDNPTVAENTVISGNQSGVSFYIDENGTKHYTIVSVDIPTIHGDQSP